MSGSAAFNQMMKEMSSSWENVRISDFYKGKLRVLEWINFYFAVVGSGSGLVAGEIVYWKWDGYSDTDVNILNWISLLSSIVLALTIIFRYVCILWHMVVKHFATKDDNLKTVGLLKPMIIEVILNGIAPMPYLNEYHFETVTNDPKVNARYTVNTMLSWISMVRIYMLIRGLLAMSIYFSSRSERVCQMNGCKATYYFTTRCLMKDKPFSFMWYLFLLVLFYGGYGLMVWERVLGDQHFENFVNCMWCTVITMTTVGYGDFYAQTLLGRITAILICIVGVFVVSFVVVALTNLLELTEGEQKALIILKRLRLKETMKILATKAINELAVRKILWRKYPEKTVKINACTRNYNEHIRNFSFASRALKALAPARSEVDAVSRDVDEVKDSFTEMLSKLNTLLEKKVEFPEQ